MRTSNFWVLSLVTGAVLTVGSADIVRADDSEIFFGQTSSESAANIMFILDTSGSMNNTITTRDSYDATQTYTGSCTAGNVYYGRADRDPPSCNSNIAIPTAQFHCSAASTALGSGGSGWYLDDAIRWRAEPTRRGTRYNWSTSFSDRDDDVVFSDVTCYGDHASAPYPNGNSPRSDDDKFSNDEDDSWWDGGSRNARKFYSANYLNWYNDSSISVTRSRIEIMKDAAESVLSSISGVKVGLMRYSADAEGGMVTMPIAPIEENVTQMIANLNEYQPTGNTPLTETLWEAYRYFSGGDVEYGADSVECHPDYVDLEPSGSNGDCTQYRSLPSVPAARTGGLASSNRYASPMEYSCQKNFVVYLTDGLPTSDTGANGGDRVGGLPGVTCGDASVNGGCLAALTEYMADTNLMPTPSENADDDEGTVISHFIGFGDDVNSGTAFDYLTAAATAGEGQAFPAGDLDSLVTALTTIVQQARSVNTTFTAASVAVNAFNRTQTLNDLYVSVFQPSATRRWSGNMKKYRIEDGQVVDVNGDLAVNDTSGFFATTSHSYWSASSDGDNVNEGGAASRLPLPDSRDVYTYLGADDTPGAPVTLGATHAFNETNVTAAHLALDSAGDPALADLVAWIRGEDVKGEYSDRDVRLSMGDPIHAAPAVVIYGGTPTNKDITDAVVYVPTNDGMLHAFAPIAATSPTDESVEELWAFIPKEVLPGLKDLYLNELSSERQYLLDGEIRVLKYDINSDGVVDASAGDRVLLFFGRGRGGQRYYALDVTDKNSPEFMWSIGPDELPGLGYAWSTPTIARVNINGADQNSQKLVLVLGGGYDPIEDDNVYYGANSMGNAVFMVDALSGDVIWSAGIDDADLGIDYDLDLPMMDHAIPSPVTVMDTNSDGYADRMYAGDMAGQLWRFDIRNSDDATTTTTVENSAANAVTGGVIASLGAHDLEAPVAGTEIRRLYNAPDVAAVQRAGAAPYFAVSIGSGYRGHPLRADAQDRFYVIRDAQPFRALSQSEYEDYTVVTDAALTDISSSITPVIPADSPGWKLIFSNSGEKVLSTAVTFKNQVFFTTYAPPDGTSSVCSIGVGKNRAYALSIVDGSPISDLNGDGETTADDRSIVLQQGGIAPPVSILFPTPDAPPDSGEGEEEPCEGVDCQNEGGEETYPVQQGTICLSGVEVLGTCTDFDSRVKTYWREAGAN